MGVEPHPATPRLRTDFLPGRMGPLRLLFPLGMVIRRRGDFELTTNKVHTGKDDVVSGNKYAVTASLPPTYQVHSTYTLLHVYLC